MCSFTTFLILPSDLQAIGGTCENPRNRMCSVTINDTLHTSIGASRQKEQPDDYDTDVEC